LDFRKHVGGCISDVELSPTNFDTIYAGAASGGVFKSVDGGQNWIPIFDEALGLSSRNAQGFSAAFRHLHLSLEGK